MRALTNIIITIAGCTILFGVYSGKYLWILIGLIPLLVIIATTFFKVRSAFINDTAERIAELEQLKRTGEKILVNLDHCEITDSSYYQDIIDERMTRFSQINLDYGKVIGQEHVGQSLLVYHYPGTNGKERFMQAFPCGKEVLKISVIRNQVTLYIDRYNRSNYFFDLKTD